MTPPDLTRTALVVVDMQNDFLTEGGAFTRRHRDAAQLTSAVRGLVEAARQQGRAIAWVMSAYSSEAPEALRGETHTGKPCCAPGTWGAQLVAPLAAILREEAPREFAVTKRWYAALRDTELHARLQAAGVTRVALCGVGTDASVLATARAALERGYAVEVIDEATTAATASKHAAAIKAIERLGGVRREWGEFVAEGGPAAITGLGAGGTTLWCGALRDVIADGSATYAALEAEVDWQAMLHRGGEVPRRVAIQGLIEPDGVQPLYRHPVDEQPPLRPFTPIVDAIRRACEARVGHRLNHCLIQLYRDGRDWIGEHADKTLDVARPSNIVNVSLGRTRTMVLRTKRSAAGDARATRRVPLPHGSFLVMDLETNREFFHAIRQENAAHADEPRISLTFRDIGTRWDPRTGAVWGVGAEAADRATAEAEAAARAALPPEVRAQREREASLRMLHLFRDENQDPEFDAASYRPGFSIVNLRSVNGPA